MSAQEQQSAPGWLRILGDFAALTFPWVLIFKQAGIIFTPPAEVSEPILWLAGAMLGIPGVAQILLFKFGGGTGMGGSPPPVASQASGHGSSSTGQSGADA